MPRISRTPEEIEVFKKRILDAALYVVINQGFSNLSMRKIASRLGVTATTIYNYYSSRDELYFFIRIRGFEFLHETLVANYDSKSQPHERLCAAVRAYVQFGADNPDYYEIMFLSRDVPKFLDCFGAPFEAFAASEKETAMNVFLFIAKAISENGNIPPEQAQYTTIKLWTELNGIVSLLNSRLLREVEEDTGQLVESLTADICKRYGQLVSDNHNNII